MTTRLFSAVLWIAAASISLFITLGNVALVKFSQEAEQSLAEADLQRDIFASDSFASGPTRWLSHCLSEGLRSQKDLRLRQLDLLYGHESLLQTQRRLQEDHDFLLNYLRCNPSDANAWLGAAMIMKTMNNDADVTMKYLAFSKFYAPGDASIARTRLEILKTVSPRLKAEYQDLFLENPASDTQSAQPGG